MARYTGIVHSFVNSSIIKVSNARVFEAGNTTSSFKIAFDIRRIIESRSRDVWRAQCSSTKLIRTEMFTLESTHLDTEAELELIWLPTSLKEVDFRLVNQRIGLAGVLKQCNKVLYYFNACAGNVNTVHLKVVELTVCCEFPVKSQSFTATKLGNQSCLLTV